MDVAIIGGGAAGFFSAISVKENFPDSRVTIFEKSRKLLSKVKISGGGRCNVTNACSDINELSGFYPRGKRALNKAFHEFSTKDAMQWFESRGVPLVVQDDDCVFPESQNSQSIIDCFLEQAKNLKIDIQIGAGIKAIKPVDKGLQLTFSKEDLPARVFDKVIVATGGSPKRKGMDWLELLGHKIENPVPSLFTFNMPTESITKLMGVVAENATVTIQGEKLTASGPLLVTHWGMSGPAILKLSAFGARLLNENNYEFKIQVNWASVKNNNVVMENFMGIIHNHQHKLLTSVRPFSLPDRLWRYLLEKNNISNDKKWSELGKKGLNKLIDMLTNDIYCVKGKTTFKEEFVTCGGISLDCIDIKTMQSKVCKNLYICGELLDMDGITGGFNFQAAWTTAYIAGKLH